jgi:hypothetical protein
VHCGGHETPVRQVLEGHGPALFDTSHLRRRREAIRAGMKGRRGSLTDVDPATGVEVPEAPVAG